MNVEYVVVGEFQVNCLIVWSDPSGAIVVDPGKDAAAIRGALDRNGLSVAAYMLTHGHMDHVSAVAELYKAEPAPVGLHGLDLEWAFGPGNSMPPFYGVPEKPGKIERLLEHDQLWADGGLSYRVLSTPGHSPGSVCFHFEDDGVLLSGDTLFAGSVGRTDFPGGSATVLQQSLQQLKGLPDGTVVHTGHGPSTTIEREKRTNYFMQGI